MLSTYFKIILHTNFQLLWTSKFLISFSKTLKFEILPQEYGKEWKEFFWNMIGQKNRKISKLTKLKLDKLNAVKGGHNVIAIATFAGKYPCLTFNDCHCRQGKIEYPYVLTPPYLRFPEFNKVDPKTHHPNPWISCLSGDDQTYWGSPTTPPDSSSGTRATWPGSSGSSAWASTLVLPLLQEIKHKARSIPK